MKKPWKPVGLGEVLAPVSRTEQVDQLKEYRLLGVRLEGGGAFHRETKLGSQLSTTKLRRVNDGDFIYSRLFAWRGAFGVIGPDLHGSYVSNEFPTFRPVDGKIDVKFLRLWFRLPTTISRVEADCSGSTPQTRNRFKEQFFLAMKIPLPPLSEQQRIVTRIEELAAKIEEVRELRQQVVEETDRLLVAMAHRRDLSKEAKLEAGWEQTALSDVITQMQDAESVDPSKSYPNLGIYSFGRGLFPKSPIEGMSTSAQTLYRVRKGQFIYSRLFAFEGAYGVVSKQFDGHYVSNEYPTFELDQNRVNAAFLNAYFKSPRIWSEIAAGSQGLGHRRQRVQPDKILRHRLMLPPIDWQQQIADVHTKVDALQQLGTKSSTELEALLPSILDKAFKGEL